MDWNPNDDMVQPTKAGIPWMSQPTDEGTCVPALHLHLLTSFTIKNNSHC